MEIEERDFIDLLQAYFRVRTEKTEKIVRDIASKHGYPIADNK